MAIVISMKHNTTRPVAVNAGPRTLRRGQADNGVRANGNTSTPTRTKEPPMKTQRVHRDQAEAEAARRYPEWDTPSADQERHRAGYWAFIAGAGWSANQSGRSET